MSVAVDYAQRLGIESQLLMVPSLALGTGGVTLLELTTAYTAFANQGRVAAPRLIARVDDPAGVTIYNAPERHQVAISPTTAAPTPILRARWPGPDNGAAASRSAARIFTGQARSDACLRSISGPSSAPMFSHSV